MSATNQRLCAWSGIVLTVLFGIGLWPIARFFPPHLPASGATDIAAIFQHNTNDIRIGMIVLLMGGGFFAPFIAVIAQQMRRIENGVPLLTNVQLITGTANLMFFLISPLLWTAIAFRPERAPEITQLANDFAWILFIMAVPPFVFQTLSIGLAILGDKQARPVFPKWMAFANFWIALLSLPSLMLTFFKTGPFAWNGVIAFYLPASMFFVWLFVMFYGLMGAIRCEESESARRP